MSAAAVTQPQPQPLFSPQWPDIDLLHQLPSPTPSSPESNEIGALVDDSGGTTTSPLPQTPKKPRRPKSVRVKGGSAGRVKARVKNGIPCLTVSLSGREIEEDVWAFFRGRPPRRPRRRARHVQSKLDQGYPGLWLEKVTMDRYKIHDQF